MFKKITDERLKLKNLENIRIVYIVQTLGIIAILGYDMFKNGFDALTKNPLWFVFLITMITSGYLTMGISVDHESEGKPPKKGLSLSLFILLIISIVTGVLVTLTDGSHIWNGLLIGGIIFLCGLAPIIYIYFLRKKQQDD